MHVHVHTPEGEAKFWMTPAIQLAVHHGLKAGDLKLIEAIIREHEDEIKDAWKRHFRS